VPSCTAGAGTGSGREKQQQKPQIFFTRRRDGTEDSVNQQQSSGEADYVGSDNRQPTIETGRICDSHRSPHRQSQAAIMSGFG